MWAIKKLTNIGAILTLVPIPKNIITLEIIEYFKCPYLLTKNRKYIDQTQNIVRMVSNAKK